jgi:type IV secretory pathway VirB4 component
LYRSNNYGVVNIFNGSTKTVTSNNQADIDEATRKNASLAYGQEQYGKEYGRLAETTPMLEGETMDAYGARLDAMTKNNLGISFANKITDYALVDVPELQQTTREVMLTPQEYSNVIYKQLEGNSVTPAMLNQANNAIKNYTDAYTKQNKVNSELAVNSATLDDYKAIIDANGGNSKNITTIDGAKAKLKEIETKIKANSKNTGGGLADVLKATTTTGLDSDHLATIQAEAANRKISNKDLAALIELGDKPGDSLPVLSSTQRDYVLDALRQYPLK